MKLINLNAWGGRRRQLLLDFIDSRKEETDFFCFQEVFKSDRAVKNPNGSWSNLLEDFRNILVDFNFYFSPTFHGSDFDNKVDYPLSQGLATFWKKTLDVKQKGEIFVHRKEGDMGWFEEKQRPNPPKNFQYIIFGNFLVLNVHGYWEPAPKYDTPERFRQSEIILEFVKKYDLPKVIAGDFNQAIDTKSLSIYEENGFRNLVKESGATTTRSSLYDIKWRAIDLFADYILVSKDVEVKDFKIMPDAVSDHLPLYLEFNV